MMKNGFLTRIATAMLCVVQLGLAAEAFGQPQERVVPREHPSNEASGVDIDRFVGDPYRAVTRSINGGLAARSMLRRGDPYKPGPNGAVLEYREDLSLVELEPGFPTSVYESPLTHFYYVQGGEGTIDSGPGTPSFELRNGIGILVGPNVKQRFVSTGDRRLSMIALSWSDNEGLTPPSAILTVDTIAKPFGPRQAHWVHMAKGMFNSDNGINMTMSAIYFPPMSYGGPHAHVEGVEEIWVKVGSDEGYALLGSEIRRIAGTGAFLSPPNGLTPHSSMNLSSEHPSVWLYLSRRAPRQ
jgi:mannose-6-phosphate isomerase-like protein (cupin superfamily)